MFARIAKAASEKEGQFYQDKLALTHYYIQRVLPELSSRIAKIKSGAEVIMGFSEDYFTNQA